jgi:hypothetical protein
LWLLGLNNTQLLQGQKQDIRRKKKHIGFKMFHTWNSHHLIGGAAYQIFLFICLDQRINNKLAAGQGLFQFSLGFTSFLFIYFTLFLIMTQFQIFQIGGLWQSLEKIK